MDNTNGQVQQPWPKKGVMTLVRKTSIKEEITRSIWGLGLLSLMEIDACLQALKRKTHDALDKSKLGIYQSL